MEVRHNVRCHVHGEPIAVSCSLPECAFYTEYPGVKNCILVYMAKQNLTSLKAIDLSILKRIPEATVSKELAKAAVTMRAGTLTVAYNGELDPDYITLEGRNVCYVCEAPMNARARKRGSYVRLPKSNDRIWYCSTGCLKEKPPQWVSLEKMCRTDIKAIVSWAAKKYSTLGGLEQALGMNRQLLGRSLKELLGVRADEIYPTTKRVKTRSNSLVRRTGSKPEWLVRIQDHFSPIVYEMERKHGKVSLDLTSMRKEALGIIESL